MKEHQINELISIAKSIVLFLIDYDPIRERDVIFAMVEEMEPGEDSSCLVAHNIQGETFKAWLCEQYRIKTGEECHPHGIGDVLAVLRGSIHRREIDAGVYVLDKSRRELPKKLDSSQITFFSN